MNAMNGFLLYSGDDWDCDRGYKKRGATYLAVLVPESAELSYSGSEWECNPGYHREEDVCAHNKI